MTRNVVCLTTQGIEISMGAGNKHGQYGDKVAKHYKFWTTFCNDRTVLKHVCRISIPVTQEVRQTSKVQEIKMNNAEKVFVRKKLKYLIDSGCIEKLEKPIANGWLSNICHRASWGSAVR